ncbi:hypothetical protein H1Q59_04800 [Holosporaceae bacterium 'Namur']|nr:hypothetical protein [Holosporaceae bacterium 'Namur']
MPKINKIPFKNKALNNELKDKLINYLEPSYEGGGYAGYGFSSDSQQLSTQPCYNVTTFSSGQHGKIELKTAYSFSEIQKMLKIDVTTKGKFGMFSGSADAEYMRSIQDDSNSFSQSYFQYIADTIKVKLAGVEQNALNAIGKDSYNSNLVKPYFGIVCGDKYIDSYDEGASLIMSINLNFGSHYEKEEFKAKAGASWGNIFSASGEIQKIANELNIGGSVSIQALQVGGDPSQLSKILEKDSSGKYYVLSCDLKAMDNCINAASSLLNYAVNDFRTQISNNTGLTPLGAGFAHSEKIEHIGLIPPKTLVNSTVIEDRNLLSELLETNKSYQDYSDQLISHYPVTWNTNSKLYKNIKNFEKEIEYNIGKIVNYNDPSESALGCFDHPEDCDFITQNIVNDLVNITNTDLDFLKAIKYSFPLGFFTLYKNGDENSWAPQATPPGTGSIIWGGKADSLSFTDSSLSTTGLYKSGSNGMDCWYNIKGNSNDGINYSIYSRWCCVDKWNCDSGEGVISKQISPYYEGIDQGFMNNGQMLNQIQLSWEGIDSL